jgi:hypothetical protein
MNVGIRGENPLVELSLRHASHHGVGHIAHESNHAASLEFVDLKRVSLQRGRFDLVLVFEQYGERRTEQVEETTLLQPLSAVRLIFVLSASMA